MSTSEESSRLLRNERDRERRRNETKVQKEARRAKRNEKDRARRALRKQTGVMTNIIRPTYLLLPRNSK